MLINKIKSSLHFHATLCEITNANKKIENEQFDTSWTIKSQIDILKNLFKSSLIMYIELGITWQVGLFQFKMLICPLRQKDPVCVLNTSSENIFNKFCILVYIWIQYISIHNWFHEMFFQLPGTLRIFNSNYKKVGLLFC